MASKAALSSVGLTDGPALSTAHCASTFSDAKPDLSEPSTENVPATIEKACNQGYRGLAVGVAILYDTSLSPVDVRRAIHDVAY